MSSNILLTGSGNKVKGNVSNADLIGFTDMIIDDTYNNKTSIRNDAVVIEETTMAINVPISNAVDIPVDIGKVEKGADFGTEIRYRTYFVNANSGSDVVVTLNDFGVMYCFVRTDSSGNVVRLDPASGNINGAAYFDMTTQYEMVFVVFDGTNWYKK